MSSEPTLNPRQREAVEHLGTPLLVLAGAGSGKTRVITHKIAHLIQVHGIEPRHITAVTFTNKAAREMKSRVGRLSTGRPARGLTVSTFHALGLGLLRREHVRLGYRDGFSILDTQDTEGLLRELTQTSPQDAELGALRWRISNWKNALVAPSAALAQAEDELQADHARLYARYQRQLMAYNALDFDDLISVPAHALQDHPPLREHWQNRIRHLLIDEYQDTNTSQYALMRLLTGTGNLTVVGDDDQSVYAWRGARPENLALLTHDYPTLKVIKLEENYRSTDRILQTANRLIANNPHLFEKRLWSARGPGEAIRILPCKDPEHEAERVVGEILRLRFKYRDPYRHYAILYRGNHQSRPLEGALRTHHIPYRISGGSSFFERTEVRDVLAYLRLLANPDDDPAFLRVVNTPRRHIGAGTLERLGRYAEQRDTSLMAASQELGLTEHLSAQARQRLAGFGDWIRETARRARDGDPAVVARQLMAELGYRDWLMETSKSREGAERRMENVDELLDWMARITHEDQDADDRLGDLVTRMSLMDLLDRNDEGADQDAVQLMTLHAAKGLEFPHVWMIGMEEGLLPHHSASEAQQVEEERRLTYVGITRAQQDLTLTYPTRRSRYGENIETEPSRFLEELPREHVVWEDGSAAPGSPRARESGKAHLSNLKALLRD
jgi:ATP-dependent DNA helicase Rep